MENSAARRNEVGNNSASSNNNNNNNDIPKFRNEDMTLAGRNTLSNILRRPKRKPLSSRVMRQEFLDNMQEEYGWLLPGWIVEERHMINGRVYKYFYNPAGQQYPYKTDVLGVWEQANLIVLDA